MSGKRPRNQFIEAHAYFLKKRLARVPYDVIESHFTTHVDFSKKLAQGKLIDELLSNLQIFSEDHDFVKAFSDFFRDYVLSAKESQYLLQIKNSSDVLKWVKSWEGNKFIGQNHDFELNTCLKLGERLLSNDVGALSFPTDVAFLIAKSHRVVSIPDGKEIREVHPTREFELIFRKDHQLIEIRGDQQVIRDFVNTSADELGNPLKSAASIAIGDEKDDLKKRSILAPAKHVKIDKLKAALNGAYTSASSKVKGSRTRSITVDLDPMRDSSEETDKELRGLLDRVLKDPDNGRISFTYNKKEYSFGITKAGGLTFMKYTPEEVVTYILSKIQNL
jgi:hypothetical protein